MRKCVGAEIKKKTTFQPHVRYYKLYNASPTNNHGPSDIDAFFYLPITTVHTPKWQVDYRKPGPFYTPLTQKYEKTAQNI